MYMYFKCTYNVRGVPLHIDRVVKKCRRLASDCLGKAGRFINGGGRGAYNWDFMVLRKATKTRCMRLFTFRGQHRYKNVHTGVNC